MTRTALATREAQEPECVALVRRASQRLAAALPAHWTAERMAQVISVVVYKTPDLMKCVPESIITAVIHGGSLDLDFTPGMNEAFLIPRWNDKLKCMEAQFQPGYKGLEKLACRTRVVKTIQPCEVCERDAFRVWKEDADTHFTHEPAFGSDRGNIAYVYAVARLSDGGVLIEVMTAEEVEGIHQQSDSARGARAKGRDEFGPWVSHWKEMALKTVVKRLCKRLPRQSGDPAQAKAFEALNAAIEADNVQYVDDAPALPKPANDSGHGHGMYASPEQTRAYLDGLEKWLSVQNAKWLDHWTDSHGSTPQGVKGEFLNRYQSDAHLVKWACDTGRLDPASLEQTKLRQLGRHVAIVYHRSKAERVAVGREMEAYAAIQWDRACEAVLKKHPELAEPADAEPLAEDESQDCDPDCDYPEDLQGDSA